MVKSLQIVNFSYAVGKCVWSLPADLLISSPGAVRVTGESGSGKTIFLDALLGLRPRISGVICVDGEVAAENLRDLYPSVLYVSQRTAVPDIPVEAFITGTEAGSCDRRAVITHLEETGLLDEGVGPESLLGRFGSRVSGGQLQRLFVCRALYTRPKLLVLDEAFSNLPSAMEERLLSRLISDNENGLILWTSHSNALDRVKGARVDVSAFLRGSSNGHD